MNIHTFPLFAKAKRRHPSPRWLVWLVICALFSVAPDAGGLHAAASDPTGDPSPAATAADFAPGEVLVGVHRDAALFAKGGDATAGNLDELSVWAGVSLLGVDELTITDAADAPIFLRLRVKPGDEMATIAQLQKMSAVAFAEPNWIVHAALGSAEESPTPVLPSDPLFRANQWGMQRIGAPRAWAISQGSTIQVAIVDSGIDFNHPEFAGRILPGKNYITPGAPPQDTAGHGTHIAGIIGAGLNNGVGVVGLAPHVIIDPRKTLNSFGVGTVADVALSIREAADAGAKIINLSVTIGAPSIALETAVNYAVAKGILLVAAAGNNAPNPVFWPAAYAGVLAVAATDRSDQRTYYSNTGAVDLAAPGGLSSQLIYSTWPTGIKGCIDTPTGYCTAFGTSMSAAYVSGVAALVWGMRPELTLIQIRNLLLETARRTGAPSTDLGAGRLDAQAAVRQALLSDIQLSRTQISGLRLEDSPAYTETLTLENPSGELILWEASVISGSEWLTLQPAASNSVRYGEPARLSVTISPTLLSANDYTGSLRIVGTRGNNSQISLTVPVELHIRSILHTAYLTSIVRTTADYDWQVADGEGKQSVQLSNDSSIGLLLPFTYTVESQAVTSVRLYADGFLAFPASESVNGLPVACTPDESPAQQAIYGWWSDLNPSLGGSVSTFTSTAGAFVAEFLAVPLASSTDQRVSFQIALYADGRVKLSYAALPEAVGGLPVQAVAVGMEVNGGLLSTRSACRQGRRVLGALPVAGETITIVPSDWR